jgi:hypothetical protein
MELEITPEPSPEERAALEQALAEAAAEPGDPRGPWWREGLSAALDEDRSSFADGDGPTGRRPQSQSS